MQRSLLVASLLLILATGYAGYLEARRLEPAAILPTLTGEVEYCLTCHADLPEISPSHPVEAFGCVLCHGGERLALEADLAHSTLRGGANPADPAVVEQSCGGETCHSGAAAENRDHIQRVTTSIQSTYAGAIASLRYTFGAQPDLEPRLAARAVQDTSLPSATGILALGAFQPDSESSPQLQAFGRNCLACHLNAEPLEGPAYARFTGCPACHSPQGSDQPAAEQIHRLTTATPYQQCNTCHNRGNYDLRQLTFAPREDQPAKRFEDYYQPIAQFTQCEYTLDCIDCHTRLEAMGDGDLHAAQADIQYVMCKTCHGTLEALPLTYTLRYPNDVAFTLARLNPALALQPGDTVLMTEQGEALWNTRVLPDGAYELIGKVTRQRFRFYPVMGSGCEQDPARQESQYCHACHAMQR